MKKNELGLKSSRAGIRHIGFSPSCVLLVILLFLSPGVWGQETKTITGTVTDQSGQPLPGATVVEEGTTNGTVTNNDGVYVINVPENATLTFSFVGMKTQQVAVNSRTKIDIKLEEESIRLEEVVAIGYGTQTKRDITGSISSIKEEDIANTPIASMDGIIQGKSSGIMVIQNSGAPGSGMSVRIRGNSTISAGNEPLYVVDGIPINSATNDGLGMGGTGLNNLADINPNDIASIEVLKDASAGAVYGARASNGVVLVTTKKGITGKPIVAVNVYYGVQNLARKLPAMNSAQYRKYKTMIFKNEGHPAYSSTIWEDVTDSIANPYYTNNTDWQDEIFRLAPYLNTDMSVRGGSSDLKYYISGGYMNQSGIMIGSDMERYTIKTNLDFKVSERFTVGSIVNYSHRINSRVSETASNLGVLSNMFNTPPMYTPTFPSDWPNIVDAGRVPGGELPTNMSTVPFQEAKTDRLIGNVYGEYNFTKHLKFRSSIAIDFLSLKEQYFLPSTMGAQSSSRKSGARHFLDYNWVNENIFTYNNILADKHNLTIMAGFTQEKRTGEYVLAEASSAATDNIRTVNAGVNLLTASSAESSNGLMSFLGRINYAYFDRYLMSATIRHDGSSRFGENKKFGTFPSVSVGWRVSEESFMRNINSISDLKFRISYGLTGNQNIGDYVAQGTMVSGQDYNGKAGIAASSNGIPNLDLTWESTAQFDVGFDLAMYNQRLSFVGDYYIKTTKDLLFNAEVPETSGFTGITTNLGTVENRGFEFSLLSRNLVGKFKWTTNANITFNRNKVLELPGGADIISSYNILREGEPLGTFYGYKFLGVYARDEDVPEELTQNGYKVKGGYAIFENTDENDVIDVNDMQIIGHADPKFVGGFTNDFSYKACDLSILFTYAYGGEILNRTNAAREGGGFFQVPGPRMLQMWQNQGDITNFPIQMRTDPPKNYRANSSFYLEDASYLRLKNVTLSYNFSEDILQKFRVNGARIYLTGQNLITFTKYYGFDPEGKSYPNGIDQYNYPSARAIILGIDLKF